MIIIFLLLFILQTTANRNEYKQTIKLKQNEQKQLQYPPMVNPQIIFSPSFIGNYSVNNTDKKCIVYLYSEADQITNMTLYNTQNGIKMLTINTVSGEYIMKAILPIIPFLFILCLIIAIIILIKMIYRFIASLIEAITDTFFNQGQLVEDYFNDNFGILPEDYFYLLLSQKIFTRPDEIARRFPEHNFETVAEKRRREEKKLAKERAKCFGLKMKCREKCSGCNC